MVKQTLTIVHGILRTTLETMLREFLDAEVSIGSELLGGWSNINIPITFEEKQCVLKLPGISSTESNPFQYEFHIMKILSDHDYAPTPLLLGELTCEPPLPLMIYEYMPGVIKESIIEFSDDQMLLLNKALNDIASLNFHGIRVFRTAADFLSELQTRLARTRSAIVHASPQLDRMGARFDACLDSLLTISDDVPWVCSFMHGDLQESNIILRNGGIAFIDFENSARGDPLLDIAYLYHQHPVSLDPTGFPLVHGEDSKRLKAMVPLALASIVSWCVDYLWHIQNCTLDSTLVTPDLFSRVLQYTRTKLDNLSATINVT